jgi:hypothetical protein
MTLAKSPTRLSAFHKEYALARDYYARGHLDSAFNHLERAHVLGQAWPLRHTQAHWMMLKVGFRRRDLREVFGQIIRLAAGGFLTLIGRVPEGNTGGANVPPERPMPLPPDLRDLCEARDKV